MAQRRLTVVDNEPEAELLCSLLRANGIPCFYKRTDFSAAVADGFLGGGGGLGPTEVWVDEEDLPRARQLAEPS